MSSQASLRPDVASRVLPRVTRRLVGFAFVCYVVAYIDRVNVGFVSTILQRELGLSNQAYGFGAGLFFLGYFQPTFWTIPPAFLGGTAAAAGIALINSIGNLGGQLGPWLVGSLRDLTHSHSSGLLVLAGLLVVEAVLVVSLRLAVPEVPAVPARG